MHPYRVVGVQVSAVTKVISGGYRSPVLATAGARFFGSDVDFLSRLKKYGYMVCYHPFN